MSRRPWPSLPAVLLGLWLAVLAGPLVAAEAVILCYHRFGPTVADGMTTRTATFEQQIARLKADGWQFVPLDTVIEGLRGRKPLPEKAVAITIIVQREKLPVTLFIYPSAISNASYAMTWEQLQALKDTGYFSIEAHTYWHPNFKTEKKRLTADAYAKLVKLQLEKPRQVLARRLGAQADVLAWPFGIHDAELEAAAAAAGYRAALALEERPATATDSPFALPRFLIVDASGVNGLSKLIQPRSTKQP